MASDECLRGLNPDDHYGSLRVLFHGLRVEYSPEGRRGRESFTHDGLSGEPRHGVSERLGIDCTCLSAKDRATTPLLRGEDEKLQPSVGDEAMDVFTRKLKDIMAQHGNESVAFLSTGQICTEELALLGALFKFGMGALHCDSNTRQCMATAHVAYKQSFGFDAPPFTYADFEQTDTLVFIGANPCIAHPIMWQRVMRNPGKPQIIVVDPRRTETAMSATQHVRVEAQIRPNTALRNRKFVDA